MTLILFIIIFNIYVSVSAILGNILPKFFESIEDDIPVFRDSDSFGLAMILNILVWPLFLPSTLLLYPIAILRRNSKLRKTLKEKELILQETINRELDSFLAEEDPENDD